MKKGIIALAVVAAMTMLTGCEYVKPGEVGIKVNKLGDDKGVGEVVGGRAGTPLCTPFRPLSR